MAICHSAPQSRTLQTYCFAICCLLLGLVSLSGGLLSAAMPVSMWPVAIGGGESATGEFQRSVGGRFWLDKWFGQRTGGTDVFAILSVH